MTAKKKQQIVGRGRTRRSKAGSSHLVVKRGGYWARRRVPLDLTETLGDSDLTKPLGTASKREAAKLAERWNSQLDAGFAAIRGGLAPQEDQRDWLRDFAAKAVTTLQSQADKALAGTLSQEDADEAANAYSEVYSLLAEPVTNGERWAIEASLRLVEEDPASLPPDMQHRMAVLSLRAIQSMRFDVAKLTPMLAARLPAVPPRAPAASNGISAADITAIVRAEVAAGKKAKRAKTLGDALASYVTLKTQRGDWTTGDDSAKTTLGKFVAAMGQHRELDDVTSEEMVGYLASLKTKAGKPVSNGTRTQYHAIISAFYSEGIKQEWATRNPASGLRPKKTRAAHESRDAFNDDELRLVFGAGILDEASGARQRLREKASYPSRLWVPLLSLTMTLRVEEASQLHLGDLVELESLPCLRVAPDDETGKRVKSRTSIRTLPIPSVMLTLGFMEYVNQRRADTENDPKAPLFPELQATGGRRYSSRVVDWFGGSTGYLSRLKVKRKSLTFHSLRHTAIDRLHRAGVDGILRSAIEGHARTGGVGETTYIKQGSLGDMRAALDRVEWAEALGLLCAALERPLSSRAAAVGGSRG